MMRRTIKKALGLAVVAYMGIASMIPAYAADAAEESVDIMELTKVELGEWLDIEAAAQQYGADTEELLDKIYTDLHSEGVFSPFSDIELAISGNEEAEYIGARTTGIPYLVQNQDSTMYLATGNPCASGNYPYVGCVAVHKTSSTDRTPIFPFGTYIQYQGSSVNIGGVEYSSFTVEDTGDASFTRTLYWTDVYGGEMTAENVMMARQYGVKKVNFVWD